MTWSGISTVKNILIVFLLIGMISAVWRASGTIPMIIYTAGGFIRPAAFLVITFLLNCLLSILTGTSFGTSATMGVICMSIGTAMGMNPVYMGGAILGGAFFGDRCSPMSTSALF
jgi:NhaC family Na+:H+ antiporter